VSWDASGAVGPWGVSPEAGAGVGVGMDLGVGMIEPATGPDWPPLRWKLQNTAPATSTTRTANPATTRGDERRSRSLFLSATTASSHSSKNRLSWRWASR